MARTPWPWQVELAAESVATPAGAAPCASQYEAHPWFVEFIEQLQQADEGFWQRYHALTDAQQSHQQPLTQAQFMQLYTSQWQSRLLDLRSRILQRQGQSFYTIGSSGHEANAAVAAALRVTDPALLHYRSGAFYVERSKQLPGQTPLYDMLLSFAASKLDPISGGRHKVLGSVPLNIWPQTSTIASHLPKAIGAAFAVSLHERQQQHQGYSIPDTAQADSIVLCSFGDASANHASAQTAFNSAAWTSYQGLPLPLLLLCEDNQIGISTPTPAGWISHRLQSYSDIHYFTADGRNLTETYRVAEQAAAYVRERRKPAFLHLKTIRLFGHAGADAETAYLTKAKIADNLADDPLWFGAAYVLAQGWLTAEQLADWLRALDQQIARISYSACAQPKLHGAAEITASLVPSTAVQPMPALNEPMSAASLSFDSHNLGKPQHIAKLLNWALHQLLAQYPQIVMCGEDIAKKGGVYGVTQHLVQQYGYNRVINTLLDEQSILGLAIGLAQQGFIAMPEIQFLAYVHNAEDQIRGEAATLPFFSNGQLANGMVVRIAGLAYQRGFGGHFHNDNSFAVFRDIPGLLLFCPSTGEDAVLMLRQAVALAQQQKRLVIFLEPIALYMTRDLHQPQDGLWLSAMPAIDAPLPALGEPKVYGDGADIALVSYGNGHFLCQQAKQQLAEQGIAARVIDLRYLVPLAIDAIIDALANCQQVLIVDECRRRGSVSEELYTLLHERKPEHFVVNRLCAEDSFIPLGSAAYDVLPSCGAIVSAAVAQLAAAPATSKKSAAVKAKRSKINASEAV